MGMRDSLGLGSRFAFSCNVHATAVRWHPSCMMASYQQSTSSNTPRSTESLETLVQSLKATRGYKLCDFRETGDACIQYRDENNCIFHRCCRRGGCRDRSEFKNRTEQTSRAESERRRWGRPANLIPPSDPTWVALPRSRSRSHTRPPPRETGAEPCSPRSILWTSRCFRLKSAGMREQRRVRTYSSAG